MMELQDVYITQLCIRKVRHLKDIMIPVSSPEKTEKKHLIITGKNGSGKNNSPGCSCTYLYDTCEENSLNEQNQIAWEKETDQIADTEKQITIRMN